MPRKPATHPLLKYLRANGHSYRAAAEALKCHYTNVHHICMLGQMPAPSLAKRIVKWTRGAITMDALYQ